MNDKTNVEEIIGLVKTDEVTNSVEEVRKLRGRGETMSDFLVEGHVREYYDIRELELPSREFIHRILKRIRECEKLGIDYEEYIDKSCFQTLLDILDCCLENKDNPNLKRRDF